MKIPMEILYGAAFVGLFAFFGFRVKKTDPRFDGFRLGSKGGMIFSIGWLVLAIVDNYESLRFFQNLGYIFAVIGFVVMVIGSVKHAKNVFNPGEFDAKREVDSDYDLPYELCPHCRKTQIRMYRNKMKCPSCNGIIKLGAD